MIEAKSTEPKPPLHSYPKLMKNSDGEIVLFYTHGEGTIVANSESVGGYSSGWNMTRFQNYNGAVTLQNIPE